MAMIVQIVPTLPGMEPEVDAQHGRVPQKQPGTQVVLFPVGEHVRPDVPPSSAKAHRIASCSTEDE